MAIFKILKSHSLQKLGRSEFLVSFVEGSLRPDESFFCYLQGHPIRFMVLDVYSEGQSTRLVCSGPLNYQDEYCNAVIDTSAIGRTAAFRYEHPPKQA